MSWFCRVVMCRQELLAAMLKMMGLLHQLCSNTCALALQAVIVKMGAGEGSSFARHASVWVSPPSSRLL